MFAPVLFARLFRRACGGDRETSTRSIPCRSMPRAACGHHGARNAGMTPSPSSSPSRSRPTLVESHPLPTAFDDALAQGRELVGEGRSHDGARRSCSRRRSSSTRSVRSRTSSSRGSTSRAVIAGLEVIAAANKCVKLAPTSSRAWNTKGRAELERASRTTDAIEAFTKSVELDRDNVWAWNNLGFTELQLKKYDAAAEHLADRGDERARARPATCSTTSAPRSSSLADRLDDARDGVREGRQARLDRGGARAASASRGVKSIAIAKDEASTATKKIDDGRRRCRCQRDGGPTADRCGSEAPSDTARAARTDETGSSTSTVVDALMSEHEHEHEQIRAGEGEPRSTKADAKSTILRKIKGTDVRSLGTVSKL